MVGFSFNSTMVRLKGFAQLAACVRLSMSCFNSTMVRLKVDRYGTETDGSYPKTVSIPQWFD